MQFLDALRRPEYTGDRRCWPCTVVNAVVVLVLAAVVGVVWPPASLVVALIGLALVALRGYVVPYTPQFAPAVAASLPLSFGHGTARGSADSGSLAADTDLEGGDSEQGNPEQVLATLAGAGVLGGGEELALTEEFRADWNGRMATLREIDPSALADAAAAAAPWDGTGEVVEGRVRVRGDGHDAWLSRPVAIAETAAVEALVDAGVPTDHAAKAAPPLRMFLETCPSCGGPVTETTRANCCGGTAGALDRPDTSVLACQDCEAELYVLEPVAASE